jgi:hypothetical protein
MARYRKQQLLAATSITTAGEKVIDIKSSDILSRLSVIVRLTNASWTATGHPAKAVTNIELVHGSHTLFGMRGQYAAALAFYSSKKVPHTYCNFTDNGQASAVMPIYFGRRLWDRELALDPKRYTNLQLKVTHNYALGGAAPDGATLEVWADFFDDEQPSPMGFLRAESLWGKTLVASTSDYIDLPTDYPIRLLLPAVSSDSEEPDINIDAVKVTESADKKTLVESGVLELLQDYETEWPAIAEYLDGRASSTQVYFYVTPAKDVLFSPLASQDADSYWNVPWTGGQKRGIVTSAAAPTFACQVWGRCPHGMFPVPVSEVDEMESFWSVPQSGSRRIKMTTGGGDTSALYELIIQQMQAY